MTLCCEGTAITTAHITVVDTPVFNPFFESFEAMRAEIAFAKKGIHIYNGMYMTYSMLIIPYMVQKHFFVFGLPHSNWLVNPGSTKDNDLYL